MSIRTFLAALLLAAAPLAVPRMTQAQGTAAEHVAAGDREHERHDAAAALAHYEAALKLEPQRYDALWKASRSSVDLGEAATGGKRQHALYLAGEQYARRAVAANARDAEGHFALARALGRTALSVSARERIRYATDIRAEALRALELDPAHPGALHVMGMWNAEIMRLNAFTRTIAKNFLGGQVFGTASWAEAQRYLEEAVRVDPQRIIHKLDLGMIYRDVGKKAKAREMFEATIRGPVLEPNDVRYKREAEAALGKL